MLSQESTNNHEGPCQTPGTAGDVGLVIHEQGPSRSHGVAGGVGLVIHEGSSHTTGAAGDVGELVIHEGPYHSGAAHDVGLVIREGPPCTSGAAGGDVELAIHEGPCRTTEAAADVGWVINEGPCHSGTAHDVGLVIHEGPYRTGAARDGRSLSHARPSRTGASMISDRTGVICNEGCYHDGAGGIREGHDGDISPMTGELVTHVDFAINNKNRDNDDAGEVEAVGDNIANSKIDQHTTLVPHFWPERVPPDQETQKLLQQQLETQYTSTDWIPVQLIQEIESYFPAIHHIDVSNEGQRCLKAFSENISHFFQVGRVFINYKQFAAVGQYLLDAWAVSSSHGAKSLICYYGAPCKKAKEPSDPKRQLVVSPKQICCPFRVSRFC